MRNQQILEEASDWFVRMRNGNNAAESNIEFMEWLRRSPEHVRAYLDIAAVWMEARHVDVDSDLNIDERIAIAKADKNLADLIPRVERRTLGAFERQRWPLVAAALILAVGAAGVWWYLVRSTYSTEIGEQRSIALRDGSTIELNSQSRVRIQFDEDRRNIELLQGQALFHVAKDPVRPFIVRADKTAVRAVGTVFDVYRKSSGTIVTVLEGVVSVSARPETPHLGRTPKSPSQRTSETLEASPAESPPYPKPKRLSEMLLQAGEQLVLNPEIPPRQMPVNPAAATAWTRRELVFEFTPLAEAVAEFNRYNERQLIVEDKSLRGFKISGVFRSTDSGSLVRYLQNMPGVRIEEDDYAVRIISDRK